MEYLLRINHHADQHTELLLDGIKPCIARLQKNNHSLSVAIRVHWLHGPHILIGIAAPSSHQRQAAVKSIGTAALAWMQQNPSNPITDLDGYKKKSIALAAAENIQFNWSGLRPTDTVSPADYTVPHFLGDPGLSAIRDEFASITLNDVFEIIALRKNSDAAALLRLAEIFLLIEQLSGPPMLAFWPMSLQAQVEATKQETPTIYENICTVASRLLPFLPASALAPLDDDILHSADQCKSKWHYNLAELQRRVEVYVACLSPDYFMDMERAVLERRERSPENAHNVPFEILAKNRVHFAYRIFMNMLYGLFPVVGFSAWNRVLVGCIVQKWLSQHRPDILNKSKIYSRRLIDKS